MGKLTAQLQDFESSRGYEQELILSQLEVQKRKLDKQLIDLQSKLERNPELVEFDKLHEELQTERMNMPVQVCYVHVSFIHKDIENLIYRKMNNNK